MNPAAIGARLLGLFLPAETARRFALPGFILACVLAGLLAGGVFSAAWRVFDWFNDRAAVAEDRRAANVEQLEGQIKADTTAAETRVADALAQQEQEQAYADAIANRRPGESADPRVRLSCERLRRSGKDTAGIPACGGY